MHSIILFAICFLDSIEYTNFSDVEDLTEEKKTEIVLFTECFEGIGCIEVSKEWYDPTFRPVNFKPLERHVIKTEFLLITNDDSDTLVFEKISATEKSISYAGFQKGADVILTIHDFTSDGYTGWVKHLGSAILEKYSINLISVDWDAGAEPPFDQAIANARVVALEIIAFINILLMMGTSKDDIHLIGHGVGAHIAGYVGMQIKDLKKITGLDPTGPRFQYMPEIVRLHPGCAKYVEVLHTDYFDRVSQGSEEQMGDADFYINNAGIQPGCQEVKHHPLLHVGREELLPGQILPGCSHKRAFKYFIESIENRDCIFIGMRCPSYTDYMNGKCLRCSSDDEGDTCLTFGLSSKHNASSNHSYYLNTASENPFCLFIYAISIELDTDKKSYTGFFELFLTDEDDHVANVSFADQHNKYRTFKPESLNTLMYYASHPKLGKLKEARVKWNTKNSFLSKFSFKKEGIPVKKILIEPVTRSPVYTTLFKPVLCGDTDEVPQGSFRTFKAYEVISETEARNIEHESITKTTTPKPKSTSAKTTKKVRKKKKD